MSDRDTNLPNYQHRCQGCGKKWDDGQLILMGTPKPTSTIKQEAENLRASLASVSMQLQIAVGECCVAMLASVNAYGAALFNKTPSAGQLAEARAAAQKRLAALGLKVGDTD